MNIEFELALAREEGMELQRAKVDSRVCELRRQLGLAQMEIAALKQRNAGLQKHMAKREQLAVAMVTCPQAFGLRRLEVTLQ